MNIGKKLFPILLVILSLMSVNQWNYVFSVGNTAISWVVNSLMVVIAFKHVSSCHYFKDRNYRLCLYFLLWMVINAIRGGLFMCEGYWDYKNLAAGVFALSMPLFAMYFSDPDLLKHTLRKWNKWLPYLFFFLFAWCTYSDAVQFLMTPVLFYALFYKQLTSRWKIVVLIVAALMLLDVSARSQIIKALFSILLAFSFSYKRFFKPKYLRIAYYLVILIPFTLLFLGITDRYNVFENMERNNSNMVTERVNSEGEVVDEMLAVDTRTFIYREVITSAVLHNYVIWGRTPARGNDSVQFGAQLSELMHDTGRMERFDNEVGLTNVFTWLGIIGFVLISLIHLRAAWLALFYSNSFYLKVVGLAILFNWLMSWVENCTGFNILNFTIWIQIAIGLSVKFRSMSDKDFKSWINQLLVRTI